MTTGIYQASSSADTAAQTTPVSFKLDVNSCDGRTEFGIALTDYYRFTSTFLDGDTAYICFEQAALGLATERPFFLVAEGSKHVWNTNHVHSASYSHGQALAQGPIKSGSARDLRRVISANLSARSKTMQVPVSWAHAPAS